MSPDAEPYLPALRYRFLTRFYDRVVGTLLKERPLKTRLIRQAGARAGERVLDLGCGTATLTAMVQREAPQAFVLGVDGDLETLALARRKCASGAEPVRLCAALAQELPFAAGSFHRVVSSLFFHHLARPSKRTVFAEIRRTLRHGGELHILDWGKAQDPLARVMFLGIQALDGFATTNDNVRGVLPSLARESGFTEARVTHSERSLLGTLSLYRMADASPRVGAQGTETSRM